MSQVDLFGIGLTLTLIGGLAVLVEYSPLANTKLFRNWVYWDAPGRTHRQRRRSSLVLSCCVLFAGHAFLVAGAIRWLV